MPLPRRLLTALWIVPGLLLGVLIILLRPFDLGPWPRGPADVEAQVWAAAIRHVSQGEWRVEVLDTTLDSAHEPRDPAEVERLVSAVMAKGLAAPPALLRAHTAAARPGRDLADALALPWGYRMIRVRNSAEWDTMHGGPYRSYFAPELLVSVGRVTVSMTGARRWWRWGRAVRGSAAEAAFSCSAATVAGGRWRVVDFMGMWIA